VVDSGLELTSLRFENYKTVLYCQEDGAWVAEVPALTGCYVVMPTPEDALREIVRVFGIIAEEFRAKGLALPPDNTQVVRVMRKGA
jgi:predicted RNase H-like HicB family nuclease